MALLSLFMKENHTWLYSDLWRTIINNCTRLFILSSLIYKCTKKSNIIIVNEHVHVYCTYTVHGCLHSILHVET